MKILIFLTTVIAFILSCDDATDSKQNSPPISVYEITYDSVLAAKYGADDYGMRRYVMAFLKRGTNTDISKERASELQKAHLENITRMAEDGMLSV
jgi:hypothetical protein